MKLTSKVGIAFAILCGLMAMGTAISFFSLGRINSEFTFVVQDLSSLADQGSVVGKGLLRVNKLANDMVLNETSAGLEQGKAAVGKEMDGLKKSLAALNNSLSQLDNVDAAKQQVNSLMRQLDKINATSEELYSGKQAILAETAKIGKVKADFLTKLSFAKIAVDLSFKPYAEQDPYIDSLAKQLVSQMGTMEYMVNAIFSAQSTKEMKSIQANAASTTGMLLKNADVL